MTDHELVSALQLELIHSPTHLLAYSGTIHLAGQWPVPPPTHPHCPLTPFHPLTHPLIHPAPYPPSQPTAHRITQTTAHSSSSVAYDLVGEADMKIPRMVFV